RKVQVAGGHPARAVFDVADQRALADVEIEGASSAAHAHKRYDQMHRHRGFAGAALLVADDDNMRLPMRRRGFVGVGKRHNAHPPKSAGAAVLAWDATP